MTAAKVEQNRDFLAFAKGLEPEDRLAEMLCGLVMVLSILLTAGYYVAGSRDPAQALLVAAIGCNLAWGIIDGLFYIGYALIDRSKTGRMITLVQGSSGKDAAIEELRDQTGGLILDALDEGEQTRALDLLYAGLKDAEIPETKILREDWFAALGALLLNVGATIPATIPFLLIPDWRVALRVSNLVIIVMLFFVGFRFASIIHANPWKIGGMLVLLGSLMVAIAVALGG